VDPVAVGQIVKPTTLPDTDVPEIVHNRFVLTDILMLSTYSTLLRSAKVTETARGVLAVT
jgi:hypothetical protein